MEHNLLVSLRKYRPGEGNDPLENFITEAFAWILKNYDEFSILFISYVLEKLNIKKDINNPKWSTQTNFDGFVPDMLCEINDFVLIFEHKAWANLYQGQLDNYRNFAKKQYQESYTILITATANQHSQNPDFALCWFDIHRFTDEWIKNQKGDCHFIFKDFLKLLENEGMGPPAPISHESILSYYPGNELELQIKSLLNRVKKNSILLEYNAIPDRELLIKDRWGRIGIDFLGAEDKFWRPGVFVGFLLDGYDHCVKTVLGRKSPDFSIIISFDKQLHNKYPQNNAYKAFVTHISNKIKELNQDWDFYHHIEDKSVKEINKWHPIHIRKPILHIFRGTLSAEEQTEKFVENSVQILDIIFKCDEFNSLRNECKE
jgi:PD-(D/E)XK nuclease superfamily